MRPKMPQMKPKTGQNEARDGQSEAQDGQDEALGAQVGQDEAPGRGEPQILLKFCTSWGPLGGLLGALWRS